MYFSPLTLSSSQRVLPSHLPVRLRVSGISFTVSVLSCRSTYIHCVKLVALSFRIYRVASAGPLKPKTISSVVSSSGSS